MGRNTIEPLKARANGHNIVGQNPPTNTQQCCDLLRPFAWAFRLILQGTYPYSQYMGVLHPPLPGIDLARSLIRPQTVVFMTVVCFFYARLSFLSFRKRCEHTNKSKDKLTYMEQTNRHHLDRITQTEGSTQSNELTKSTSLFTKYT